jgi:hypothetical protein
MTRLAAAPWFTPVALALGVTCGTAQAAAQTTTVAIPDVTGPVPVTATSVPLMASNTLQTLVNLPRAGYVEEEFFVSGRANIYDWTAAGGVTVKTPNAPYTTRILVRRPSNPQRFSGNVIIEVPNAARRFDFSFAWGVSHDAFMENGDVFVVLTMAQGNIEGLKAYDAMRYAGLSLANPTPDEACASGRAGSPPATSNTEEGLQYDMLAQVAALLKAPRPGGPLAGFNVQRAYLTAYDGVLATYIAALHPRVRLANGRPIYDGYVINRQPAVGRLRRCGMAPSADDPRQLIRNLDVPVIRIIGQTDIIATYAKRREDSDTATDRYRLYEVAGGAHADAFFYPYMPTVADLRKIGSNFAFLAAWPFANQCEPEQLLAKVPINTFVMDAAFQNLTRWIKDGVAPPRAERISIEGSGTPQAKVMLDKNGNAVGGYRTPYTEVPSATYHVSARGETFCPELGRIEPFDWARMNAMYGTPQNYASKVAQSADRLLKDRFITESDARKAKAETGSVAIRTN